MLHRFALRSAMTVALGAAVIGAPQLPPPPSSQDLTPAQPSEVRLILGERIGVPPRFAVPDFLALSSDPETVAIARAIGEVLWDDLAFEREFDMIPRDASRTIPAARSLTDVDFERWAELGADGVVIGTVEKAGTVLQVRVRLFNVRSQDSAFGREYTGSAANPRIYAHTMANEIHEHQRGLRGVALTRLTFASDRDRERVAGPFDNRAVKEVYVIDYDGANPRRITTSRSLSITPAWSPDGRSIAYTAFERGYQDVFISAIYEGVIDAPLGSNGRQHAWLPAWSPDGRQLAFTSNRDGNAELYVVNRDGSDLRRLTRHPSIDTSPTWSPTGNEIAFTSDRSGSPQIYVIGVDGTGIRRLTFESYCDRPTWSPAPFNEIAYSSRTGPGQHDIMVLEVATGERRQITFGQGSNESPSYSPNGRHLAFTSSRGGTKQIYTVGRDGRNLRQVTREGNNEMANWSR